MALSLERDILLCTGGNRGSLDLSLVSIRRVWECAAGCVTERREPALLPWALSSLPAPSRPHGGGVVFLIPRSSSQEQLEEWEGLGLWDAAD